MPTIPDIDLLRLSLAKTSKYQGSFSYKGAEVWNTLTSKLRNINSLPNFKKKFSNFIYGIDVVPFVM